LEDEESEKGNGMKEEGVRVDEGFIVLVLLEMNFEKSCRKWKRRLYSYCGP
jgi:hypothetical protein